MLVPVHLDSVLGYREILPDHLGMARGNLLRIWRTKAYVELFFSHKLIFDFRSVSCSLYLFSMSDMHVLLLLVLCMC